MYGQIISFLFVILIIYYVVMILLDLQKAKAAIDAELERNSEEEIDISDEASTFKPVLVTRDDANKASLQQTSENTETEITKVSMEIDEKETLQPLSPDKPFRREGYREAAMTGGLDIETLLAQVDQLAETGTSPLGQVIHECQSAHF